MSKRKGDQAAQRRNRETRGKAFIRSQKLKPCQDCDKTYQPHVMQFDHRGDDKLREVSKMAGCSQAAIEAEIAKCDLVCANCHAERTYGRSLKARYTVWAGYFLSPVPPAKPDKPAKPTPLVGPLMYPITKSIPPPWSCAPGRKTVSHRLGVILRG